MQIEVELGRLRHDLESLGIGLHQPVLDAVVDHLHEVPGPGRADMGVATLRRQGEERRLGHGDRLVGAPDHEAVALGQAPDAAGGAGIDEGDPVAASWSTSGAVSL